MMSPSIAAAIACAVFPGITAVARTPPDEHADKGASQSKTRSVVEVAQAFIDSLTQPQRAELLRTYSFSSASHWSNLPERAASAYGPLHRLAHTTPMASSRKVARRSDRLTQKRGV